MKYKYHNSSSFALHYTQIQHYTMTDFHSSPEYAAFLARQSATALETSAPGGAKVPAGKRKKSSPVSEAVAVVKAAPSKKIKKEVAEQDEKSGREETGKARKIREKGRKNNALDKIPSSNVPPMSDEDNKQAQAKADQFASDFMTVLNAVAKEIRESQPVEVQITGLAEPEEYDFSGLDLGLFDPTLHIFCDDAASG